MLSGGIDSPVAGYFAMKRGVEIEAVHFASPPYTSEQALQKAKDLAAKLAPYVGTIHFIEVPFTEIQEEIKKSVPQGYWMTITRRMPYSSWSSYFEWRIIRSSGFTNLAKYGGYQ